MSHGTPRHDPDAVVQLSIQCGEAHRASTRH